MPETTRQSSTALPDALPAPAAASCVQARSVWNFVVTGRVCIVRADDPEVVSVACASAPLALSFASERLRRDASFVLSLIEQKVAVLKHVGSNVKSDKQVVQAACALEVLSTNDFACCC